MSIPQRALELEDRYGGESGEPTLFAAYQVLRDHWLSGHQDRETGLHIAFLAWYMLVEPEPQTGYEPTEENAAELWCLTDEALDYLSPAQSEDAELLYVFGIMADVAPYHLGDSCLWERRARDFLARYRQLRPGGLDPEMFHDRGVFGDYFAMHARADRFRTATNNAMSTDSFFQDPESVYVEAVCFARCSRGAPVDWGFNVPGEALWLSQSLYFRLAKKSAVLEDLYPLYCQTRFHPTTAARLVDDLESLIADAGDVSHAAEFLLPLVRQVAEGGEAWELLIEG